MPPIVLDYDKVLQARDRVEQAHDLDALAATFGAEIGQFGAPFFRVTRYTAGGESPESLEILASRIPPALTFERLEAAFPDYVPLVHMLFEREDGVDSETDYGDGFADRLPGLLDYLQREAGVGGFIAMPRFGARGFMGYAIAYTTHRIPDPIVRAAIATLCWSAVKRGTDLARLQAAGSPLTARQRQVLEHCAQGRSHWDIANVLGLAPSTVHGYMEAAKERLGVRTRVQAVLKAAPNGWLKV